MRSGDLYHQLFEASPSAILTVVRDGHIVDCNRAACVVLARARNELLGTPVLRWVLPGDRPRCRSYFRQAFQGGIVEWKARVDRGDGMARLLVFRTVLSDATEPADRLNVFLSESTDTRPGRSEAGQLQTVLENVPGQFLLALDREGRIRYASGVARTLWYDDDECLAREPSFLFAKGADGRDFVRIVLRETGAGRQWEGAPWLVRKDGSHLLVRIFAVPYRHPHTKEIVGAFIVGRDGTREHEVREELERVERLSHIGEVVVSIARELKGPIERVARRCDELGSAVAGGEHAAAVEGLSQELDRIERLVDGLLSYAAEPRGNRGDTETRPLVERAIREQAFLFEDHGIALETTLPDDLPTTYLSPEHFQRVLRQMLTNAREALAGRSDGRIQIRAQRTSGGLEIQVRDNGCGLRDGDDERIFEPFFTTKNGHLGLGLAIARGIVAAYGGQMWAARDDDGWTTVAVALPHEPPGYAAAFRPVPMPLRRRLSVLVIDDDEGVRTMIRRFLEPFGYTVAEAWSGRSALAQITSGFMPELVVTDLRMRDGTGYWFLEQLARDYPQVLRRTVILTGDPSHAAVDRITRETGCPVVRKPFDPQVLLDRLDEVALRA